MRAWIIYDNERFTGNERFVLHLSRGLMRLGIEPLLVFAEDLERGRGSLPHVAIMRTYNQKLHMDLTKKGVLVLNDYKTTLLGNDKFRGYVFAKELGLDVMPFSLCDKDNPPDEYPVVVKSIYGHGGSEVFMVKDSKEYFDILNKLYNVFSGEYRRGTVIAQTPCDTLGKDVRAYVVGGNIEVAVLRESKSDFRSNFSLGGNVSPYSLNADEIALVKKITEKTDISYGAVDFIFHNGKPYFNEIEDIAGAKNLYMFSDRDILGKYAEYIYQRLLNLGLANCPGRA